MYAHPRKSERALYEQRRRKGVIKDAREHRVMTRWLRKVHPTIADDFDKFHNKLQRENPNKRDLTTTEDFARFMRLGDGTECAFFCFSEYGMIVECLRYVCFLDTEAPPVFSPKIPLFPPNMFQTASNQPCELSTSPAHSEVVSEADEIVQEGVREARESPTAGTSDNPFTLTDEEIDAMLEALWRAPAVAPSPTPQGVSSEIDDDLREVLEMDIGDLAHFLTVNS